ncbi:MAG: hypothetical protein E7412_06440 [Ruminococcaceae bacterium]|nr:hypothetical protein [Oscillospiraceae bacterium]
MNKIIYSTNGEIINTITYYISDGIYKYAVLIDGDWGSGKTWFIKNILMPKIDEYIKRSNLNSKYKKTIYLTLNGLESINEISAKLFFCIFPEGKGNVTKKISSIVNALLKSGNININVTDIGNLLSSFVNI